MKPNQIIPKDAILPIPQHLPSVPDGYVFLGKNKDFEYEWESTKYGFAYLDDDCTRFIVREINDIVSRGDEDAYYIFPENSETVKLNLNLAKVNKEMAKTFEEKLAEAKAMVGKKVGSIYPEDMDTFVVKNVRVVLDGEESSHSAEMEAAEYGYAVCLEDGVRIRPYNLCVVCEEKNEIFHGSNKISFDLVKSNGVIKVGDLVHYIDKRFFLELNKLLNLNINMGFTLQTPIKIGPYIFERGEIKEIAERIEQEIK